MKYLILISVILFTGCATTLPPAGPSSTPMEKADAVWIKTSDDPETAYRKIAQSITDAGYTISSSDAVLMNITTEPFRPEESFGDALSSGGMTVVLNASVREQETTIIKLTGKFNMPESSYMPGVSDNEIVNQGGKTTYTRRSWEELTRIAESYSGGTLEYTRNK